MTPSADPLDNRPEEPTAVAPKIKSMATMMAPNITFSTVMSLK